MELEMPIIGKHTMTNKTEYKIYSANFQEQLQKF